MQIQENQQKTIRQLALYELLDALCKMEAETAYIASHNIEDDSPTLSDQEAVDMAHWLLKEEEQHRINDDTHPSFAKFWREFREVFPKFSQDCRGFVASET